jgi:hypothetical protein
MKNNLMALLAVGRYYRQDDKMVALEFVLKGIHDTA